MDSPSSDEPQRFGRRIDALIRTGQLGEESVRRLLAADSPTLDDTSGLGQTLDGTEVSAGALQESGRLAVLAERGSAGPRLVPDGSTGGMPSSVSVGGYPVLHWDRYEFLGLLGRGGMGAVYKARDRRLNRLVALKFIYGNDDTMNQRFLQEARAQSRLAHPNICQVYEVGEVDNKPYIAMELVSGLPLDEAGAAMSLVAKLQVMKLAAEAMHAAHEQGVIHRDLKPSNIMVERTPSGELRPVVMDFGLARDSGAPAGLTETGAVMGTPSYMSPEQARGEARRLDRRSDVYSLGATLFDLLTGRVPFEDETVVGVLLLVMNKEAPKLRSIDRALPAELETIVARCLAKDKEQRYETAQNLAVDLGRFLNREKILAKNLSLVYRLQWQARQNKPAAALLLSLLVLLVGFTGYGLRSRYLAQKQAALARQISQESKDLEWMVRIAHALPLHNVETEQAMVRARMQQVENQLRSYGNLAGGLIHYALGRGHLTLHEHKEARFHLEEARRLGERQPELYASLGRVLGELYNEALLEARRSGEKTWVEKRQKELQRELLVPAQEMLGKALTRQSELLLDSPEYIEGLLAFYGGRYEEADRKAQAALAAVPWLAEAAKLRGDIAQTRALEKVGKGSHEEARGLLGEAIGYYQKAADISRSDGQVHAALARAQMDLAEVDRFQGRPQEQDFAAALAAAERAVVALPSSASGYLEQARVFLLSARAAQLKGKDATEIFNQSIRFAEQALARDPKEFIAWDILGNSLADRGTRESLSGKNPESTWQRGVESFNKAIAIAPNFPWAHNDLGSFYWGWGNYYRNQGRDPRERYKQAIIAAKRASQLDPLYLFSYTTVVGILGESADYSQTRGQDFPEILAQAKQLAQQCGAGCASYLTFQQNMAVLYLTAGQHESRKGADPRLAISISRSYLASFRELNKNSYSECLFSRLADMVEAEYLSSIKIEPTQLIENALLALPACKAKNAQLEDPYVVEARLLLVRASWLSRHGGKFSSSAQAAMAAAARALELNPESVDATHEKSRAAFWVAIGLTGKAKSAQLADGLAAIEQGFKVRAESGPLLAMRAVLLLTLASAAHDPTEQIDLQQRAQESWRLALAINPLLAREYGAMIPPN